MRKIVYIAGPLTKGNRITNTMTAMEVGMILLKCGYSPIIPHLTSFIPGNELIPYDIWMESCYSLVSVSKALLRLSGESKGADLEEKLARKLGIPVYYELNQLLREISSDDGNKTWDL